MNNTIPHCNTEAKTHLPWISRELIRMQRNETKAIKKAKQTGLNKQLVQFRELRRQTTKALATSQKSYLNNQIGDSLKASPKRFRSFIKANKRENIGIPTLRINDKPITNDRDKANALNNQFTSVFTSERYPIPVIYPSLYSSMPPLDIGTNLIKCQQNNHNSFLIFSLNCQSLNAKFDEIKIQIETFRNGGCEISAFCLQETWLGEDYDTSLLQIEGYTLISQGKICSSHAGLAIYLNNKYKYKTVEVFEKSNIWESQFLEITYQTMTKTIILGNVYRPPKDINENYQTFIDEFANKLVYLNNNRNEVIIAGDYNIDLLKINDKPIISEYFDTITSHGFFPKITLPTRLSDHHGTLIDNFLCKLCKGFFKSTSGILISNISDHFPYFISLENTQPVNTLPKFKISKKHNPESMMKFKTELMKLDIYNNLNKDVFADPNENYNLLEEIITDTMNKSIPR